MATQLTPQNWPSEYPPQVTDYYGNPASGPNGQLSASWQKQYLVHVPTVYDMVWDLDPKDGRGKPVHSWIFNKECADSVVRCFKAILEAFPDAADREKHKLNWWGGSFNFRPMVAGHSLSMHAYAVAFDLAPTWNPRGTPYDPTKGMLPQRVVDIFDEESWTWGGRWHGDTIDCMHFQAAHL